MKLLVLGNSHAATLRAAVDKSDFEVSFAAGSSQILNDLEFEDDRVRLGGPSAENPAQRHLWALTTGSDGPFDMSPFDVVLVACVVPPVNPWQMNNINAAGYAVERFIDSPPMSYALFKASCDYKRTIASTIKLAEGIQSGNPERPVFFLPRPMVREDAAEIVPELRTPDAWSRLAPAAKREICENEAELYRRYHRENGISVLDVPAEVVVDGYRCPSRYSEGALGSRNFESGHAPQWDQVPRHNLRHKNQEYGEVLWRYLNRTITERVAALRANVIETRTPENVG